MMMINDIVKRKSQRGAAMVEAIVVIPVLIMLFAAMVYINGLYTNKQISMREARQEAWTLAMKACEGSARENGTDPLSEAEQGGFQVPPDTPGPVDMGESTSSNDGGKGKTTVDKSLGVFSGKEGWFIGSAVGKSTRKAAGWATAAADHELTTTTKVTCNEVKDGGSNLFDVLSTAWDYLKPPPPATE